MKIGIDLGGSHIAIGVVDDNGKIIEKIEKRITDFEKQDIKKTIEEIITLHSLELCEKYEITELGIAMPGWAIDGVVQTSGNLNIRDYPIIERLQEKIKLPMQIRNDAKCAGIAENKYGCLKDYERSVFLTLGTGIGGAVFVDNQLLNTGKVPGCEFGHMVIEKDGIPCNCGRKGCFERYASMKVFKKNLKEALNLDESTRGEELIEIIRRNNPENENYDIVERQVSEYIENLSTGILNLINIFEPEIIGIGGSFVYFEDVLLERLRNKLKQEKINTIGGKDIIIETAVLGNDAGIIGAVS